MRSPQDLARKFKEARRAMAALDAKLPRIIGTVAVQVVKNNFKLQGYDTGSGVQKWPARAEVTNRSYDYRSSVKGSVYNSSNPILEQTRNLYNAIRYQITGKKVRIGVDLTVVPYGEKMNDGGSGTWGKYAKTETPARKYMPNDTDGPNLAFLRPIERKIKFEREKVMKEFKK